MFTTFGGKRARSTALLFFVATNDIRSLMLDEWHLITINDKKIITF